MRFTVENTSAWISLRVATDVLPLWCTLAL
jgi:hypothetical protein